MKNLHMKILMSIVISLLIIIQLEAQDQSTITVRASNPQYIAESNLYTLDVELQSDTEGQQLFGMNVRFFYDAYKMVFSHFSDFQEGYEQIGPIPARHHLGDLSSGYDMFSLEQQAGYVNGAVQVEGEETTVDISTDGWTHYFTLNFALKETVTKEGEFCPSLIWDLQSDQNRGGYLRGSDGVVITVFEK